MPPKKTKQRKNPRQLNIKCGDDFYAVSEWVRTIEGLSISDTIRTLYLDRAMCQIAFAVEVKALTVAVVDDAFRTHANGKQSGIERAIISLLMKACGKDREFPKRYQLYVAEHGTRSASVERIRALFWKNTELWFRLSAK